jgi:hypothetical protein
MYYHELPYGNTNYHVSPSITLREYKLPWITINYHVLPSITIREYKLPCITIDYHTGIQITMDYYVLHGFLNDGGYVKTYAFTYVVYVDTSHTSGEGARSPSWPNGLIVNILLLPLLRLADAAATLL